MELLGSGEVHLKIALLGEFISSSHVQKAMRLLSVEEKAKQQNYSFDKDKNLYLLARYLVRTSLSKYTTGISPADWKFEFNPYGRPFIANANKPSNLYFNLAHTDGIVVCAIASTGEVGVDVENSMRVCSYLDLAEHCFSEREIERFKSFTTEQQAAEFFKFWTLKESYIKARGMGLQLPLDQFSFLINKDDDIKIMFDERMNEDSARWQFMLQQPISNFQVAIALATEKPLKVRRELIRFD